LNATAAAALLGLVVAVGAFPSAGVLFLGVFYRSLYGEEAYAVLNGLIYVSVYAVAAFVLHAGGRVPIDAAVIQSVGLVFAALVMVMIKEALEREGRTRARERLLRDVGLALVAARTPEAAHSAALAAVLTLLPAEASARASIWRREGSVLHAVAAAGDGADLVQGTVLPRDELPRAIKRAITNGGMARITPDMPASARPKVAYPDKRAGTLLVALSTQDGVLGALVISSDLPICDVLEDTLVAIASQVALAIESDELTADLHRRQNEERFGSLIANASDVITVVSEAHVVLYQTPSITRVLGAGDITRRTHHRLHPSRRPTDGRCVSQSRGAATRRDRNRGMAIRRRSRGLARPGGRGGKPHG
jgi:PAS domain-containing protein